MLFEVLSQPIIFLFMTVGGFCSGFIFDAKNILLSVFKKKRILEHFLMFFATFFTLFLCFFFNLRFNYGQFRFFSISAFTLAFTLERFLISNFVAKPAIKCYNKMRQKRVEKRERKQTKGKI